MSPRFVTIPIEKYDRLREEMHGDLVQKVRELEVELKEIETMYDEQAERCRKHSRELVAARAVIAAVGRETWASVPGDCTGCYDHPGHTESCPWKAYDDAVKP